MFCATCIKQSTFSLLQEISGLQNCLQLEKLYLYENKISEIKNLDLQVHLEVLWINNNCITKIKVRVVAPLLFCVCNARFLII